MSRDVPDEIRVRVVRGDPDVTELAALIAVLAALGTRVATPEPRKRWATSGRFRAPTHPAPGAWRASGLPG